MNELRRQIAQALWDYSIDHDESIQRARVFEQADAIIASLKLEVDQKWRCVGGTETKNHFVQDRRYITPWKQMEKKPKKQVVNEVVNPPFSKVFREGGTPKWRNESEAEKALDEMGF